MNVHKPLSNCTSVVAKICFAASLMLIGVKYIRMNSHTFKSSVSIMKVYTDMQQQALVKFCLMKVLVMCIFKHDESNSNKIR